MKSNRYLKHSKGQKQFLLLCAILCLISFLVRLLPRDDKRDVLKENVNFEKYKRELDSLEQLKPVLKSFQTMSSLSPTLKDLLDSKLDSSQAKLVLDYHIKGLYFKKYLYQDPQIPKSWVALQKMIYDKQRLKENYLEKKQEYEEKKEEVPFYLELNTADTSDFIKIKGIGLKTAIKIINYKRRLGGFVSVHQLEELNLYEWDSIKSREFFYIRDTVEQRNINSLSFEQLKEHPYIGYKLARSIIEFRERRRSFKKIEELRNIQLIDDVLFSKIALYFKVE